MPAGLVWLVLSLLFLETIRLRNRLAIVGVGLAWSVYSIAGNWHFAGILAADREEAYAEIVPFDEGPFDVIVVLGGGASDGANGRFQGNGAGDRLILAAQLYHRKQVGSLICTGKRIETMDSSGVDEAQRALEILINLGVPDGAITLFGGRNSSEEMEELAKRYGGSGKKVGLITSAWHMQRVERLAQSKGFDFKPLPADFVTSPDREGPTIAAMIASLVPSADALSLSGKMWKETLAGWVGR
jgi:uncharacterized SAM-binding protein YcdF (DUF218 family)